MGSVIDIMIDVALVALPTRIVLDLHINWQKKVIVESAFAFRLIVIGAQIVRLVFVRRLQRASDKTYDALSYSIATQCQTGLTVVVVSIAALKPFMDRAASGMMAVHQGQREGTFGISGITEGYTMQSLSKNRPYGHSNPKNSGGKGGAPDHWRNRFRPDRSDHQAVVSTAKRRDTGELHIQRTVDFEVQYSDEAELDPQDQLPTDDEMEDDRLT
ncbi:hypothetical protein LTR85_011680 [Meristemomyces frigidus]|nr:hypothetical protein LTR85_011680 [Meristemomyces frigidus]